MAKKLLTINFSVVIVKSLNNKFMTQEYLSLKKAAEEFSISVRTLYRMRERKVLFFHKLGGRTLIRKPELEILIQREEIL